MGKVYLVGAGCGDVKLLTLKGKEAIERADVIIYDYLANEKLLRFNEKTAELIYVGKMANNHAMKQEDINKLLVEKAKSNDIVVRLKGGDPYVFGRGGEEGLELFDAEIDFEVVPGISSTIGGVAYAGIPITHRGIATSFHIITGHRKAGSEGLDFSVYAKLSGTLVFVMGIGNLDIIVNGLVKNGMDKDMPVAIIENASKPFQRTIVGKLSDIACKAKDMDVKPPGLIVVGRVIDKRDALNFFEKKPLFGKKVLVTRARAQSSDLVDKLSELGAQPIEVPLIKTIEINQSILEKEIVNIGRYTHIVFTSVNAVKIVFEKLYSINKDARWLCGLKVVSVGSATASELKKHGIVADVIPEKFCGQNVFETLKPMLSSVDNVFIPCSKIAKPYLGEKIGEVCSVNRVDIYDTVLDDMDYSEVIDSINKNEVDYITFTSSSTVKNFVRVLIDNDISFSKDAKIISIGPMTSKTINEFGLSVHSEAKVYNIDGLIKEILDDK